MDLSWMWDWTSADAIPFARTIGVELIEATKERVTGRLRVRRDLCNPMGVLHGGAAISFADSLAAIGAFLNLPQDASGTTTIESKTNFFRSAKLDQLVFGEARPLHRGNLISVWEIRLAAEDRQIALVVQSYATLAANAAR